jgi:hypothetical protein
MAGTARRNTNMFEMLCGASGLQNVILVTTFWDLADEQAGPLRERELQTIFWKSMISSGSRMARFDNTNESAWSILSQLAGVRRPLRLQIEMVEEGKLLAQTAAGSILLEWLKRLVIHLGTMIAALLRRPRGIDKGSQMDEELQLIAEQRLAAEHQQRELLESGLRAESSVRALGPADEKAVTALVPEVSKEADMRRILETNRQPGEPGKKTRETQNDVEKPLAEKPTNKTHTLPVPESPKYQAKEPEKEKTPEGSRTEVEAGRPTDEANQTRSDMAKQIYELKTDSTSTANIVRDTVYDRGRGVARPTHHRHHRGRHRRRHAGRP